MNSARRWMRMDPPRRRLLAEAGLALLAAAAAIRLLPFRHAVKGSARPLGKRRAVEPRALVDAVEAASRHLPVKLMCFPRGLALQSMLRRRGFDARLHYGVGTLPPGVLKAHVWVSLDGSILIGGEEAPDFKPLAAYP